MFADLQLQENEGNVRAAGRTEKEKPESEYRTRLVKVGAFYYERAQ